MFDITPNKLSKHEILYQLDSFLVNSSELDKLTDRLSRFNIFNVLKISEMEIRHSNTLGWLLNPNESHKLGDKFLRRFLSAAILYSENVDTRIRSSELELMDFYNIEVRREYRNIDVLIVDYTNKIASIVENKLNSKESKGQLTKYNSIVDEEFGDFEKLRIYLTVEGDDPSAEGQKLGYFPFSHSEVLRILEPMVLANKSSIPDEPYIFISHYLDTLRILTMEDKEVIDLCKRIYRKHRIAIDLINQFAASTNFNEAAFNAVKNCIPEAIYARAWSRIYFLTPSLNKSLPELGGENYSSVLRPTPLVLWFKRGRKKDKCYLAIEVGDLPNYNQRKSFLDFFLNLGFDIKNQSYKEDSKISRVKTFSVSFDDDVNNEEGDLVEIAFQKLFKKAKPDIERIEKALESYQW